MEKTKLKVSKTQEIINVREEINKIQIKIIEKINKPKADILKRINKINKCLHRLTNKERERTQINKKRDNNDSVEIQKIRRKYYELVYANKLDNIEEMDKFLETYSLPRIESRRNS